MGETKWIPIIEATAMYEVSDSTLRRYIDTHKEDTNRVQKQDKKYYLNSQELGKEYKLRIDPAMITLSERQQESNIIVKHSQFMIEDLFRNNAEKDEIIKDKDALIERKNEEIKHIQEEKNAEIMLLVSRPIYKYNGFWMIFCLIIVIFLLVVTGGVYYYNVTQQIIGKSKEEIATSYKNMTILQTTKKEELTKQNQEAQEKVNEIRTANQRLFDLQKEQINSNKQEIAELKQKIKELQVLQAIHSIQTTNTDK